MYTPAGMHDSVYACFIVEWEINRKTVACQSTVTDGIFML